MRRLRYDDLASLVVRSSLRGIRREGGYTVLASPWLPRSHSGRRFVIMAALVVLVIWAALALAFRDWRARYRARASYGASQVVPAIQPMAEIVPPGVNPGAWRDAVSRTQALLQTVVASNLLDLDQMRELRGALDEAVARARAKPETALNELAGVWNAVDENAAFLFQDSRSPSGARHLRPNLLPSYGATQIVPALDPLTEFVPPDGDPAAWRDAVSQLQALVLAVTDSKHLSIRQMKELRARLDEAVAQARAHPETAIAELARVWDDFIDRAGSRLEGSGHRLSRPKILPPRSERPAAQPRSLESASRLARICAKGPLGVA
jgi:hypothetical protein